MKAEDVARLHDVSGRLRWKDLRPETRADLLHFARACEQHGVERAKAVDRTWDAERGWMTDWVAIDAEIEKENEDDRMG